MKEDKGPGKYGQIRWRIRRGLTIATCAVMGHDCHKGGMYYDWSCHWCGKIWGEPVWRKEGRDKPPVSGVDDPKKRP